jgi:hypothetical protein
MNGRPNRLPWILSLVAFVLFAAVVAGVVRHRLRAGDIFPPYSTLRADPLGYGVLHAVLERDERRVVVRHISPEDQLRAQAGDVVVMAGVDGGWRFELTDWTPVDRLAAGGAHVVLLAYPEYDYRARMEQRRADGLAARAERLERERAERESRRAAERERLRKARGGGTGPAEPEGGGSGVPDPSGERAKEEGKPVTFAGSPWKVDFSVAEKPAGEEEPPRIRGASRAAGAPEALSGTVQVSGALRVLPGEGQAWQVLYELDGEPVAVTLQRGRGRVTLFSDSFVLSNEALAAHRPVELMAHLFGDARRVVFSEHHLGVVDNRTLADLARSYGLGPAMLSAVVALGLMFWRQGSRLLQPAAEGASVAAPQVSGAAALSPLLARAATPAELPTRLLDTAASAGGSARLDPGRVEQLRRILADAAWEKPRPGPVELYLRMARALKKRR